MVEQLQRVSALAGSCRAGRHGIESSSGPGVRFSELPMGRLTQFSAWPDTTDELLAAVCDRAGTKDVPAYGGSVAGAYGSVLQIEPLKWWLIDAKPFLPAIALGVALDLSHARARLKIDGRHASELLNRHLALDLRDNVANAGKVESCALHHAPLTLWHTGSGYELFISRAYAESVFALLQKSAAQFGFEIVHHTAQPV